MVSRSKSGTGDPRLSVQASHNSSLNAYPPDGSILFAIPWRMQRLVELTTTWEGPDERRTRICDALRSGNVSVAHELAIAIGSGESVEPFSSVLCDMSAEVLAKLAISAPNDLRELALAFVKEPPGQWTPFSELDTMAEFVIGAAEALEDDDVSERGLVWVLEMGWDFNRWNVQGQAEAYLHRLAAVSPGVVARALERARPKAVPEVSRLASPGRTP